MQFINIIVHSVQDMNYRVYLQEEFKLLGLDECLKVRIVWAGFNVYLCSVLMNRNMWKFIVNVICLYYKFMLFLIIILMLVNYLKIRKQKNKQLQKYRN